MIPESFIQELLNRVDIVDVIDRSVPLKKAGSNYSACCPFHHEKTPSFTVSASKQFYHCFGCGVHGTAIRFVMEQQGLGFVEAVQNLATSVGMKMPQAQRESAQHYDRNDQQQLLATLNMTTKFYKNELKNSVKAIDYLKSRGISGKVAHHFQLGFASAGSLRKTFTEAQWPTLEVCGLMSRTEDGRYYERFRERIMFPIHNRKGEIIGYGGRALDAEQNPPKYYNSPETPLFQKSKELYGLFEARRAIQAQQQVLVVEGYMDVLALAQHGIHYAVATLGTATTLQHIQLLMRQTDRILFCFDGDSAGQKAAWRAAVNALPALKDGVELKFLFLPPEHDPDSFVRAVGTEQLTTAIEQAMPLSEYLLKHLTANNPLHSQEDRGRLLKTAVPLLKEISAPSYTLFLRKKIAELVQLSLRELEELLKLDSIVKPKKRYPFELARQAPSLKKQLVVRLFMRPHLAHVSDLDLSNGQQEEDLLLKSAIELCLQYPDSKPAALVQLLNARRGERVADNVFNALILMHDTAIEEEEIEAIRVKLRIQDAKQARQMHIADLLKKPFNTLSENERATVLAHIPSLQTDADQ